MYRQTNNKGVVLISVLLIILLLSSVAVIIGNNYLISLKRAAYLEFQSTSLNMFKNLESLALKKVDIELKFNSNKLARNNSLLNNDLYFETDEGVIIATILDNSNCFNINALVIKNQKNYIENKKSINAFRKFMSFYSVDNNLVEEMIDQAIDWIDLDSDPRAYGLEDYFYSGPLNNPKEYSGRRLFFSVDELKGIPAFRKIDWKIIKNNFCSMGANLDLTLNLNTLNLDDSFLLSSFFPNLALSEAEYIIDTIPEEGIENFNSLKALHPMKDFEAQYGNIKFSSSTFDLTTVITKNNFSAKSTSKIIYDKNKNSYIISRTYNGI
jgi:general secretion pathway protein K